MYKDLSFVDGTVSDIPAIKNAITNIVLTPRGSLPGKPEFGSDISKVVFSNLDALRTSILKNYIRESLTQFEPRIEVSKIIVKDIPEYNKIVVDIYFSYKSDSSTASDSVSISINV